MRWQGKYSFSHFKESIRFARLEYLQKQSHLCSFYILVKPPLYKHRCEKHISISDSLLPNSVLSSLVKLKGTNFSYVLPCQCLSLHSLPSPCPQILKHSTREILRSLSNKHGYYSTTMLNIYQFLSHGAGKALWKPEGFRDFMMRIFQKISKIPRIKVLPCVLVCTCNVLHRYIWMPHLDL